MRSKSLRKSLVTRAYALVMQSVPHRHVERAKRRLHPALRNRLTHGRSVDGPSLGRLSVIVPCYNVEDYLRGCLDSLVRSSYTDLEIIVVIDGSPDSSEDIARSYSRWDRRIVVVTQANAGLGAARNAGIRRATGHWIAFLDSDDDVPKHAYLDMISTLAQSGSDFVVGNLRRRQGTRSWVPVWAQDVHRRDRIATSLDEFPDILADVFSWNKVFLRSFFDREIATFPEGIRYEDQEPIAKAYAAARSFDVLSQVVYTWYIRGDGTSITQQKSNLLNLTDRLTVMGHVNDVLTSSASPHVVEHWQSKSVGLDLRLYYAEVPRTDLDYWHALVTGVRAVTRHMDVRAWQQMSLHDRVIARLVDQDQHDDVCTVLRSRSELGDGTTVDLLASPPQSLPLYLAELSYQPTPSDLEWGPADQRMRVVLYGYELHGDEIEITGSAFMPGVVVQIATSTLEASLVDAAGDRHPMPIALSRFSDLSLDALADSSATSQAASGFTVRLSQKLLATTLEPAAPLIDRAETETDAASPRYRLQLRLGVAGHSFSSNVTHWDRRWTANRFELARLHDGARTVALFDPSMGLHFFRHEPQVLATRVSVAGRNLTIEIHDKSGEPITHLSVSLRGLGGRKMVPTQPNGDGWAATVPVPNLPAGASPTTNFVWDVRAHVGGQRRPIHFVGTGCDLRADSVQGHLRPVSSPNGRLRLEDRKMHGAVTGVTVDDDGQGFTVTGHADLLPGQTFACALASNAGTWLPERQSLSPDTQQFEAHFRAAILSPWGDETARPTSGWSLRLLRNPDSTSGSFWVPVEMGQVRAISPSFLQWWSGERIALRFTVTKSARALWVSTRPPLSEVEATRAVQRSAQARIPALMHEPLRDVVLFSTFGGRSAADSPLAIYDELRRRGGESRLVWEVSDGQAVIPAGAATVLRGSIEHLELLHTSRLLVNNGNFPHWYRKRADQFYLQTWHGTPLKRIGQDVPSRSLSLSYRELMRRESAAWDVLLAQNDFAAETLPRAFRYDGRMLNLGYPRNDALAIADPPRRARVRERLGLHEGQTVVLYAPTWRDNARTATGRYAMVNHLELATVSAAFGESSVLLVRGHSNTPGLGTVRASGVLDVSAYPDINDLMLAADVLVTDYSSVMFDFVNTGRPMIFLTPDLDEYAGVTRGFYLDFATLAPGPLVTSTGEVLEVLTQLPQVAASFSERYQLFKSEFAPRDDGLAAARVVDEIWGPTP